MNPPDDIPPELPELLAALRDGLLTADELVHLDSLLAESAAARAYYLEYVELCASLRHYQGAAPLSEAAPGGSPKPAAKSRRRRRRWLIGAALTAVIGVAVALFARPADQPPVEQTEPPGKPPTAVAVPPTPRPDGVAVLTRSIGAKWLGVTLSPTVGTPLPTGRVRLTAGLIQLEFYGGATVVLEGPIDFDLLGPAHGYCRSGKLTVRLGPNARGFVVGTPRCEVTDRGTEFGLSVGETKDELYVFEGRVAVTAPAQAQVVPQEIPAGRGFWVGPNGTSGGTNSNGAQFVTARQMEQRASDDSREKYRQWKEESARLRTDRRVAVYYTFENERPWDDRTLRNCAPGDERELDGAVVGCQWAEGRWPGKGALEFKRVGDRVRVDIREEFRSFTLAAWVRVDAYDRWLSSLLLADGWERGALHWQLSDSGAIILGSSRQIRHDSPPVIGMGKLGQWTFLAAVCNQGTRTLTHYVDGRRVSSGRTFTDEPVRIGPAEIGNWGVPLAGDKNPIRSFNGRFDEFIIFRAALTAAEVRQLYEAGKPNS
jgi:hypothetical protein